MINKIISNIRIFLMYISFALKKADNIILNSNNLDNNEINGIEQKKEIESVYKDLLRGELTQEVKELRHEMYYSERKSYEYSYGGNGRAVKKNLIFDYNGNVDKSDGYKIEIVQENKEDPSSLIECGIFCNGKNVELSENALYDLRTKDKRKFTINIERDFIPSFRLEQYAKKIVVKSINEEKVILDIYVSSYRQQFDNNHKLFLNSVEKIYIGDKRSDIIDFNNLNFISYCAYGTDDLKLYEYQNIKFEDIIKFDDAYIFRFSADIKTNGYDIISEFYDEIAESKNREHELRKNASFNFENAVDTKNIDNYDTDTAKKLINELENG